MNKAILAPTETAIKLISALYASGLINEATFRNILSRYGTVEK